MILDDNLVFVDAAPVSGNSVAVDLEMFHDPSKVDKLWIVMCGYDGLTGVTAISATLQQGDSEDGDFEDVEGLSISLDESDLTNSTEKAFFPLPPTVTKQWIRLVLTVTGTATAGSFFAAITPFREVPYRTGEYIDAGVVKG